VSFVERSAEVFGDLPPWCTARAPLRLGPLRERSARLAAALRARRGRGSTVSVMLPNTPEMVEAHYAVPALGAVLNTLNTRLDAPLLAWQMNHCEAAGADHRPRVLAGDGRGAAPAARRARPRPLVIDV
jgi:fatty-acyl-CoA synthase